MDLSRIPSFFSTLMILALCRKGQQEKFVTSSRKWTDELTFGNYEFRGPFMAWEG